MTDRFELPIPDDSRKKLASGWLWLGVMALLGSGIFSVLLVMSRTPHVQDIFPWVDFFRTALVVHVDLSVLVWFLAFAGVFWTLNSTARMMLLGWSALIVAIIGTVIITISPFIGAGQPLMSNYIPVLQDNVFYVGLLTFAAGIFLLVWRSMTAVPMVGQHMSATGALRFGMNATAVSVVIALIAFAWSYAAIPDSLNGKPYFELLFWGGGHILQFTYTLLLLVAWLWLASASDVKLPITPRVVLVLFGLGLLCVFMAPIIYYAYPVTSTEHIKLFTWLMQYGGSLAALPLSIAVFIGLLKCSKASDEKRPLRSALLSSMILFGAGGVIGFMIQGSNVTIPAHYHGSIVGVTLALMGITYELLPRLGYAQPSQRLAWIQPWLYGGGQFLHIMGLVWSGGYGVQRKVAGAEQGLESVEKIAAMGLMGLGGLVSVIGGFIFIYIVLRVMLGKRKI